MDYTQFFERKTRCNGDEFYCLISEEQAGARACTIEALSELIKDIHFDHFYKCLANDWIYEVIVEAFEGLANDDIDSCQIEPDSYYNELVTWLLNPFAQEFCQEAIDDGLIGDRYMLWDLMSTGQWLAKKRIFEAVNEWLEERKNDDE